MLKRTLLLILAGWSIFTCPAKAFWRDEITMLIVPREVIPLQIAQDISRRYPVLIVSYQTVLNNLKLHAWNGEEWVPVPVEDYISGTFFSTRPEHAILIESELFRAPDVLIPVGIWCASANRLTSTDPRVMIHLLGRHFDFPFRHWNQFAERYGYTLEEINPSLVNVHWWNLRGDELLKKRANRRLFVDENKWFYQETIQPPPIESVIPAEAPVQRTEPAAPQPQPIPVIEVAPAGTAETVPQPAPAAAPVTAPEPIKVETPSQPEPQDAPAPEDKGMAATEDIPVIEPVVLFEEDPFAMDEIPAAEIILPQEEQKKSWWKLF